MSGFDERFDFIVAGSGGGSMCAALVLRSAGKRVLILEKEDLVGGTTARSGGVMWIPDNPFMRRDVVDDSVEQACAYLDSLIADRADTQGTSPRRRRRYVEEASRMVEFLVSQGIRLNRVREWPDYYDEKPGGSVAGRTVVAELFNVNELGAWKQRLRAGFLQVPASLEEALQLPSYKRSWPARWLMLKVALRGVAARLTGKRWVSAGAALQGRMLQAALRAGVEIRTGTPVVELIVEDGAVRGVVARSEGRLRRIGAELGVLVNAGGFARNQAMRDHYQPGTSVQWTMASSGDTGELIEEMMVHGAAVAQMEEMVGTQLTLPPGSEDADFKATAQRLTAAPHAILVDQSGVRYMNEGGSYMAYCKGMFARHRSVPAVPSWALFDSQLLGKTMLAGTLPGTRKPQRWRDAGYLHEAATLDELARSLKMEAATLRATVERFNGFVDVGRDADFCRGERAYDRWLGDPLQAPSPSLGKIEQAPFYAVPVVPGDVGTYGGVVTDEHARVLRADGSVIDGLYATGVSTASVMGRCYPGAGCSIGPSFVWGWVAATHAMSPLRGEG
ncbi:MAG TPA: FAD-dependent oxidoreductase [Fontimonas sp.]